MGKIWLKSSDPSHQCCGCENKAGPCDNCCVNCIGIFSSLAEAQAIMTIVKSESFDCLFNLGNNYPSEYSSFSYSSIANTVSVIASLNIVSTIVLNTGFFYIPNPTIISVTYNTLSGSISLVSSLTRRCPTAISLGFNLDSPSSGNYNYIISSPGYYYFSIQIFGTNGLSMTITNTDGSNIALNPLPFCYYTDASHKNIDVLFCS